MDLVAQLAIPNVSIYADTIADFTARHLVPRMQEPLPPEESKKLIQVPVGFELKLFASEPDIVNPIAMSWDEKGRLWVIETVDYPNSFVEMNGEARDRIKICEDTDGDGLADSFTVFADGLNIATSLVFANDGVIVSMASHFLFLKDTDDLASHYNAPYAVETATFKLKNSDVVAEATRSLFDVVRQYRESYDVYGTKMSFEWEQLQDEDHVLFEGGESARLISMPDTDDMLIPEIAAFTKREKIDDPTHVSFLQGAGHGGSHPHLVQEFVAAIVEGRDSAVDAALAANYTCAGICAHESAMKGGMRVEIPDFGQF